MKQQDKQLMASQSQVVGIDSKTAVESQKESYLDMDPDDLE